MFVLCWIGGVSLAGPAQCFVFYFCFVFVLFFLVMMYYYIVFGANAFFLLHCSRLTVVLYAALLCKICNLFSVIFLIGPINLFSDLIKKKCTTKNTLVLQIAQIVTLGTCGQFSQHVAHYVLLSQEFREQKDVWKKIKMHTDNTINICCTVKN